MGATKLNSGGNRNFRPQFSQELKIKSSVLKAVQYDPDRSILDVTLNNGNRYRYRHVSYWDFTNIVAGKSAGKVFNRLKSEDWHQARKLPRK